MLRTALKLLAVGLAGFAALMPLDPAWVERAYSDGIYLDIQHAVTSFSNAVPFALFDLVGLVVAVALFLVLVRLWFARMGRVRMLISVTRTLFVSAAFGYLLFLCLWGLNYRRLPLTRKLDFQETRITTSALVALASDAVGTMNRLRRPAQIDRWPELDDMRATLGPAFTDTQKLLGQRAAVSGRPKWSILGPWFRWTAVDGMTDPFFLEVLVRHDLLPFERPFVVAHEWAHLAGYADESEANFVGWLTCLRGDAAARYSGWTSLYLELNAALDEATSRRVAGKLEVGPKADLDALARKVDRETSPQARDASRVVYDRFLRANRVPEGIASYDAVVRLVLGTRFNERFVPRPKQSTSERATDE